MPKGPKGVRHSADTNATVVIAPPPLPCILFRQTTFKRWQRKFASAREWTATSLIGS